MTVARRAADCIGLEEECGVDNAEPLLQMLLETPAASVDWRSCRTLHTAVVQVILTLRPPVIGPCGDAWVEQWLAPALDDARSGPV